MKFFSHYYLFFVLFGIAILASSCADNPFDINFDASPPPFDTTQASRDFTLPKGTHVYIIEEGHGPFEVGYRDQISIRFTARIPNGKIFDGSYDNRGAADQPETFYNLSPNPIRVQFPYGRRTVQPLVEGLRKGLLGMREGEKRTIVIPPEAGYSNEDYRQNGVKVGDKTVTYDVELVSISG